jgi:methylmalonyl-CoA mutase N-terminal domain/subunit
LSEYSPAAAEKQIRRIRKVKDERDSQKLEEARDKLIETMEAGENMVPRLVDAVKAGLTRGEFGKIKAEVLDLPGGGPYVCTPTLVLA